jgi:hypothetical protein
LQRARRRKLTIVIPTVVVAQTARAGGRQVNLRRFLTDSWLRFVGLDYRSPARRRTAGETGTADVVDAAVAICARTLDHCSIVTSDPEDPCKLDATLPRIVV